MGFSMSIFMALMLAINIGVMVNKSLKESRRQKRLKEIKERKVDTFFELEELPGKVAVIGSGYIAVELAGILKLLGAEACRAVLSPQPHSHHRRVPHRTVPLRGVKLRRAIYLFFISVGWGAISQYGSPSSSGA